MTTADTFVSIPFDREAVEAELIVMRLKGFPYVLRIDGFFLPKVELKVIRSQEELDMHNDFLRGLHQWVVEKFEISNQKYIDWCERDHIKNEKARYKAAMEIKKSKVNKPAYRQIGYKKGRW